MRLNTYTKSSIIRAIMNDVPQPDKEKRRADLQAALVKAMSPEARKLYNRTPSALRTYHFGDIIYTGAYASRELVIGDVNNEKLAELTKPYEAEDEARRDAKSKITHIVEGCSTLKQLQTLLPEFTRYMPTESAPTKNLPAVANVVADLSKLGWPKDKTQTAVK